MLQIDVVMSEDFDETSQEFLTETRALTLEHSLVSLSKWESEYEKPFLSAEEKTTEEVMSYIKMMIISPDFPPDIIDKLAPEHFQQVNEYINAKRTATWFSEPKTAKNKHARQTVTSELIYYWMTSYNIPWEAERWHLNRLFTLIKVFGAERDDKSKTNKTARRDIAAERRALNASRRSQLGTTG